MPVARSTASGNFAGWAVAIVTTGCSPACSRAARVPVAVCGSTSRPVVACIRRISSSVSSSVERTAERRGSTARTSSLDSSRPVSRNRCICSAVRDPLPSFITHSIRSKFDDTWMSIAGLSVGTTVGHRHVAVVDEAGEDVVAVGGDDEVGDRAAPIRRATQPAKTLPKLPVGTHAVTGPASALAVVT